MCIFALGNKSYFHRMARRKKVEKAKEPIRLRFKKLANGSKSIYLDQYKDGKRSYEFLKLYLIPEVDDTARMQNENTLQAANAIKAQRVIDLTNDGAGISKASQRSKMPLIDWMRTYSKIKLQSGQSAAFSVQIDKAIKHLIKYKGEKVTLKDVDKEYCLGFIDYLNNCKNHSGELMAKVTTAGYFRCLNCALNRAVKEEFIPYNPITKIGSDQRIKIPESTREYLTVDEVKTLIAAPCVNDNVKRAYLFSCFCGLRYSDVQALTWGDVLTEGDLMRVRIVMVKTQKTLYLPLSKEAQKWMPERGDKTDSEKVFALPSSAYLNIVLRTWAQNSGLTKHVTFHTARHTFATLELTADADIYTVSKLLGHTQLRTTQIYAKIVDKKKEDAVNRLSSLFDEKIEPAKTKKRKARKKTE